MQLSEIISISEREIMPSEIYNRSNFAASGVKPATNSAEYELLKHIVVNTDNQVAMRPSKPNSNANSFEYRKKLINFARFDVVFSCLLFLTVGPSLIFLNKYIMTYIGFKFPIMLASLGIVR